MFNTIESTSIRGAKLSKEFWRGLVSALAGAIVIGLLVLIITLTG